MAAPIAARATKPQNIGLVKKANKTPNKPNTVAIAKRLRNMIGMNDNK